MVIHQCVPKFFSLQDGRGGEKHIIIAVVIPCSDSNYISYVIYFHYSAVINFHMILVISRMRNVRSRSRENQISFFTIYKSVCTAKSARKVNITLLLSLIIPKIPRYFQKKYYTLRFIPSKSNSSVGRNLKHSHRSVSDAFNWSSEYARYINIHINN